MPTLDAQQARSGAGAREQEFPVSSTDSPSGTRSRLPQIRPRPRPADVPSAPVAQRHRDDFVVDCAVYVDGERQSPVTPEEGLRVATERGGFVWLGLHEPTQAELESVASSYGLHPLAVEDAVEAHQRPKLDTYEDSLFLVLKTARYVEHDRLTAASQVVSTGEVMVFVGRHYLITVRHGDQSELRGLRASLESQHELLRLGPAAVLYAVADQAVDDFVDVATAMESDVEELEVSVFTPERTDDISRIYQLKRELMQLRRAVSPLDVPLNTLADRALDIVPDEMRSYFRDVQDHALRVRDQIGSLDELLTSILQSSLAITSLEDNEDMRKISAWAGIIAVCTFIAGVYGMNFEHMPELGWRYGYPMCLLAMALAGSLLYRGFKRSGWL